MSISQDAGSLPDVLSSPQINLRLHVNLAQGQPPPAPERRAVLRTALGAEGGRPSSVERALAAR